MNTLDYFPIIAIISNGSCALLQVIWLLFVTIICIIAIIWKFYYYYFVLSIMYIPAYSIRYTDYIHYFAGKYCYWLVRDLGHELKYFK